jgi:hypothetical protein
MKSTGNKSERVIVHVRMRPFSTDELNRDNTSPIENFDTQNSIITGIFFKLKKNSKERIREKNI